MSRVECALKVRAYRLVPLLVLPPLLGGGAIQAKSVAPFVARYRSLVVLVDAREGAGNCVRLPLGTS